jgi:hypothetical protein
MAMLRTVLRWQAVLWAVSGVALAAIPGTIVEGPLAQAPTGEGAWLRLLGVAGIVLAAQIVLVGRRLEELWWWTWSFVLLEAGVALVALTAGVLGRPEGSATWPWLTLGVVSLAFAALDVTGLARAGTERSPA